MSSKPNSRVFHCLIFLFFLYILPGAASAQDYRNLSVLGNLNLDAALTYLSVEGATACVSGQNIVYTIDISEPEELRLLGSLEIDADLGDMKLQGNYLYIILPEENELAVVDISAPDNPELSSRYQFDFEHPNFTRLDVLGDLLVIISEGDGFFILDISDPENPAQVFYRSNSRVMDLKLQGDYLYLAVSTSPGLQIFDVSEPDDSRPIASLRLEGYRVAVAGDIAYLAQSEDTVHIIDITDPWHPADMAEINTNSDNLDIKASPGYVYSTFRGSHFYVFDVQDPDRIVRAGHCNAASAIEAFETLIYTVYQGNFSILQNDLAVLPHPRLRVTPDDYDFSEVEIGDENSFEFRLTNTGDADLNFSSASIHGIDTRPFTVAEEPFVLEPDEQRTIAVNFAPVWQGDAEALLVIGSNDPVEPEISISIRGTGTADIPPLIRVPEDFGTIREAFDIAAIGDTILIGDGVYTGDESTNIRMKRRIVVMSVSGQDNTIIDCQGIDDAQCWEFDRVSASISGFTFRNADSRAVSILCSEDEGEEREVIVENCIFENNHGGLSVRNAEPLTVRNVIFTGNQNEWDGGGLYLNFCNISNIENCIFENNYGRVGGGLAVSGARRDDYHIFNCLFFNNQSSQGGGVYIYMARASTLENCTIYSCSSTGRGSGIAITNSSIDLRNNIIWNNTNEIDENVFISRSDCNLGYNCIEGGWEGEGNLDADPRLRMGAEPVRGSSQAFLDVDSPCRNAGIGNAEDFGLATMTAVVNMTLDEGRVDMGYHRSPAWYHGTGTISGLVTDTFDDEPIDGALISTSYGWETLSDDSGRWRFDYAWEGDFDLRISAGGYADSLLTDLHLEPEEALDLQTGLLRPQIAVNVEEITVETAFGEEGSAEFEIENPGTGDLVWQAYYSPPVEFDLDPGESLQSFDLEGIIGEMTPQTVIFSENQFILAAADFRRGADTIYVINRDGELLGKFLQPGNTYSGIFDLDAEFGLIWGIGENRIYGLSPEGELRDSFEIDEGIQRTITWDSENETLWTSSRDGLLIAYNSDGMRLTTIETDFRNVRGIDWAEPDKLMIFQKTDTLANLVLYDISRNTWSRILTVEMSELEGLNGAALAKGFNLYGESFVYVGANEERQYIIDVRHISQSDRWIELDPVGGRISAQESRTVNVSILTDLLSINEYRGFININHNAPGEEIRLPLSLNVHPNDAPSNELIRLPAVFSMSAPYPNPSNCRVQVNFALPVSQPVRLNVYNTAGRIVEVIDRGQCPAGNHTFSFGTDPLPSGIYFLNLQAGDESVITRIVLIK